MILINAQKVFDEIQCAFMRKTHLTRNWKEIPQSDEAYL